LAFTSDRINLSESRRFTERAAQGFAGIVLRNDTRLLDLVRNPDVEDDRQDMKLAFG
jgi:hypothetical protein